MHGSEDDMSEPKRICHMCGDEFEKRTPADKMTVEDRATELVAWGGAMEIPFSSIHKRIEELVGRPVWTHEMAYFGSLIAEVRSGNRASMAEVIGKCPPEKLIIARPEETVPDP